MDLQTFSAIEREALAMLDRLDGVRLVQFNRQGSPLDAATDEQEAALGQLRDAGFVRVHEKLVVDGVPGVDAVDVEHQGPLSDELLLREVRRTLAAKGYIDTTNDAPLPLTHAKSLLVGLTRKGVEAAALARRDAQAVLDRIAIDIADRVVESRVMVLYIKDEHHKREAEAFRKQQKRTLDRWVELVRHVWDDIDVPAAEYRATGNRRVAGMLPGRLMEVGVEAPLDVRGWSAACEKLLSYEPPTLSSRQIDDVVVPFLHAALVRKVKGGPIPPDATLVADFKAKLAACAGAKLVEPEKEQAAGDGVTPDAQLRLIAKLGELSKQIDGTGLPKTKQKRGRPRDSSQYDRADDLDIWNDWKRGHASGEYRKKSDRDTKLKLSPGTTYNACERARHPGKKLPRKKHVKPNQ